MIEQHGGNLTKYPDFLDFSANINPLGMPESVKRAVIASAAECSRYPDPDCTALTRAIAVYDNLSPEQIVCGNGAADLIYRICYALRPKHAVVCAPTFSEYESALLAVSCEIRHYMLKESCGFHIQPDILTMLTPETDILFLCTPNNPTGQRIPPDLLCKIAEACRNAHIMLICDECFLRFSADAEQYSLRRCFDAHCIILNAFTKLYAIPGLRLGYLCCGDPDLAERIRKTGQYWSVSVPAQKAGIAALHETEYVSRTVEFVTAARKKLAEELRRSGLQVYPSDANFLLLRTDKRFAENMKQQRILVRSCSNFRGLSDSHFRIAVRTTDENAALIKAIRKVYGT